MNGAERNSKKPMVPQNWPAGVGFLTAPVYSKGVTTAVQEQLVSTSPPTLHVVQRTAMPCAYVRISAIMDPSHPACGQFGLFAEQDLPPDSLILPYLGFVHTSSEENPESNYDLSLDRFLKIGIDATDVGNEARFINNYRGTGANGPNAEFRDVLLQGQTGKLEKAIAVFVLTAGKSGKRAQGIVKGQEILVSYGKGFWAERLAAANGE